MIHIQKFIERIQGFEARGQRDFIMSMKEAKDLHADITKLLLAMETLRTSKENQDIVTVEVQGGNY